MTEKDESRAAWVVDNLKSIALGIVVCGGGIVAAALVAIYAELVLLAFVVGIVIVICWMVGDFLRHPRQFRPPPGY